MTISLSSRCRWLIVSSGINKLMLSASFNPISPLILNFSQLLVREVQDYFYRFFRFIHFFIDAELVIR